MEDNRTITLERNISGSQQRRVRERIGRPSERGSEPKTRMTTQELDVQAQYRRLSRLHDQRISSWVGAWGTDHSIVSPSRDIIHARAAEEFVISNGTSPTSNAGTPLASNHTIFHITGLLGHGESTGESTIEGAANRAWSATAVRRCELASGIVVPPWSGLLIHLSGELCQDVGWQLSIVVGLGGVVTKLRWRVAIVYHGRVLIRDWRLVGGNHWAAREDMWR